MYITRKGCQPRPSGPTGNDGCYRCKISGTGRELAQVFPQTSCSIYLVTKSYCLRDNLCLPSIKDSSYFKKSSVCQAQEASTQSHSGTGASVPADIMGHLLGNKSCCLRDNLCLPSTADSPYFKKSSIARHKKPARNPTQELADLAQVFLQTSCSIYLVTRSYCLRDNLCLPSIKDWSYFIKSPVCQAQEASTQSHASFLRQLQLWI